MRVIPDLSGNGMGAAFVKLALLVQELDATSEVTSWVAVNGNFNASLAGTFAGTLRLERSLDGGLSVQPLTGGGAIVDFTTTCSESFYEPEVQALYRWKFVNRVSGTATCRIGK
jgi:hypothetical protein